MRPLSLLGSLVVVCSLALAPLSRAQEKRASPHEKVEATVGGKKITIEYGRPFKKGRVIFGKLVPWGEVWRTGADEATTLTTEADVTLGTVKVPKGTYTLFTLPTEKEWTLIINKTAKQWGAFNYDPKQDLGRTPMKAGAAPKVPIEQFTIAIEAAGPKAATLRLAWDTTVVTVPIAAP